MNEEIFLPKDELLNSCKNNPSLYYINNGQMNISYLMSINNIDVYKHLGYIRKDMVFGLDAFLNNSPSNLDYKYISE